MGKVSLRRILNFFFFPEVKVKFQYLCELNIINVFESSRIFHFCKSQMISKYGLHKVYIFCWNVDFYLPQH